MFEKGGEKIFELELENGESPPSEYSRIYIQLRFEVPIIVIFTKYDELISKLEEEIDSKQENEEDLELDDDQFQHLVEEQARDRFSEICVKPLKAITKDRSLPFLEVSISTNGLTRPGSF